MDELLYLLFNGPKLEPKEPEKPKKSYAKVPSMKMVEKYKTYSKGNQIWSLLITKHDPINCSNASRNLREMARIGYLKPVGRLKGTRSNSPPYIYEWI